MCNSIFCRNYNKIFIFEGFNFFMTHHFTMNYGSKNNKYTKHIDNSQKNSTPSNSKLAYHYLVNNLMFIGNNVLTVDNYLKLVIKLDVN